MKSKKAKYLLVNAEDDVDADDALTLLQMLRMLAGQLGYTLKKKKGGDDEKQDNPL